MSKKQLPAAVLDAVKAAKGITLHYDRLRLTFTYKGVRCRETLSEIEVTKSNVKFAQNKLAVIKHEIAIGSFNYKEHFPESPKAALFGGQAKRQRLGELAERFIDLKRGQIDPRSIKEYESYFKNLVGPRFGDRFVDTISKSEIEAWRSKDLSHYSNKYINNVFSLLRGAFALALDEQQVQADPMAAIKNLRLLSVEPDPFTRDEIQQLAGVKTDKQSEQNYITFVAWSGMRAEEALALAWEDLDLKRGVAYVNRAVTDQLYKRTKTGKARIVELLDPVLEVLSRQKALTYMKEPLEIETLETDKKTKTAESIRPVFLNTYSGKPFMDVRSFTSSFWRAFLRSAGVRHRGANQLRHTYASQLITTGEISLEWIAQQMGTSVTMLYKHYGKIIEQDRQRRGSEISKILGVESNVNNKMKVVK